MELINLEDYERAAAGKLPAMVRDYFAGGAGDGITLRRNREAFERIELHYRVLVDVGRRDLSLTLLGQRLAAPLLIAPTAFQRLAHPEGELATVRAAGAARTVMVLSTVSTCPLEEVLAAASAPVWFQLYVFKDRAATVELVRRAEAAGCEALVLTVDVPVQGHREIDIRNRFRLPEGITIANLPDMRELPAAQRGSGLGAYIASHFDPSLTWKDVEWLRSLTELPLVVKGVARADDAVRAVERGVAGVIVSNHGGRQLDGAPAAIAVLPAIADAVAGRAEVLVDGGIRRGTDVVKAIASGARAVLVGRPILWGLAVDGERGVCRVLELLRAELDGAMALCGCPSIADIGRDLLG